MGLNDVFTTGDNGKVLGLPLLKANGQTNNFAGATATVDLRDPTTGIAITRNLVFNPTPSDGGSPRWEYAFLAADLPRGHVGIWRGMAAVIFAGGIGPIYSSEFIFTVVDSD